MRVLAIETATDRASVALVEDGRERAAWRDDTSQDLCRRLAAEVGAVVARASTGFSRLDLVVAGLGPGSFTSLRIGLATAKAIALAHDLPLVGVSSLAAMAWQMTPDLRSLLCPALDARRGDLYAAVYRAGPTGLEQIKAEFIARPEELAAVLAGLGEPITMVGQLPPTAIAQLEQMGGERVSVLAAPILPEAVAVAELGRRRFEAHGPDDLPGLRPIYLRKSYAEEEFGIDLKLR
jgi:tRNA threonylcarbamoyladenosine biosynthesis protein TsaB